MRRLSLILATGLLMVGFMLVFSSSGTSFLTVSQTSAANIDHESFSSLDCLTCHPGTTGAHSKLSSGNRACFVCHENPNIAQLHLADGTQLSLSDAAQLCGQCHQGRYKAWQEGTHGIPRLSGNLDKGNCTDCHDPHQPQIALLNVTEAHPPTMPAPQPPSTVLIALLGIALLLVVTIGVAVMTKGKET